MNKATIFSTISCVCMVIAVLLLINLGFAMESVREWRMDGDRAKADALVFSRAVLLGGLLGSSYVSLRISEVLGGVKELEPVFDRTMGDH